MNEVVGESFRDLVEFLKLEFLEMPPNRWTESVLRYFFCRSLAKRFPNVEQFIECDKIDLVLRKGVESSFIEFKFYHHPKRFEPYDGRHRGYKGGAGDKNVAEFRSCVEKLFGRRCAPDLSKYIILVYADPNDGSRPKHRRYSQDYEDYQHPNSSVGLRLLQSSDAIETSDGLVRAQLYGICSAPNEELQAAKHDLR